MSETKLTGTDTIKSLGGNIDTMNINTILKGAREPKSSGTGRGRGVITIIDSQKNGKRISIKSSILERLKAKDTIQFAFTQEHVIIGTDIDGIQSDFTLKDIKGSNNKVIYSADLVKEVMTELKLTSDGNKVSRTISKHEWLKDDKGKEYLLLPKL